MKIGRKVIGALNIICLLGLSTVKKMREYGALRSKACYLKNSGELWCQGLTVIFQQKNVSDHHSFSFLENRRFYRNKLSKNPDDVIYKFFFPFFFCLRFTFVAIYSVLKLVPRIAQC